MILLEGKHHHNNDQQSQMTMKKKHNWLLGLIVVVDLVVNDLSCVVMFESSAREQTTIMI